MLSTAIVANSSAFSFSFEIYLSNNVKGWTFSTEDNDNEIREQALREWQTNWDISEKGRWTYRLIPNIKVWLNRKAGEVKCYVPQFLRRHGGYRAYLHRFGHDTSPFCPECKVAL